MPIQHPILRNVVYTLLFLSSYTQAVAVENQESAKSVAISQPTSKGHAAVGETAKPLSAAERIAGLRKLLDADRSRRDALNAEVERLERSFREASDQFTELDAQLKAAKGATETKSAEAIAKVQQIEMKWTPARDHFERIIERRKVVQQQIKILDEKLELEHETLGRLESADADVAKNAASKAAISAAKTDSELPAKSAATPENKRDANVPVAKTAMPVAAADDREVHAERELETKQADRATLGEHAQLLDRSIDVFERDLMVGNKLLKNAEAEVAAAQAAHDHVANILSRMSESDNRRPEYQRQLQADLERVAAARKDVEQQKQFITESEALLQRMRQGRLNTHGKIEQAESSVAAARSRVWFLKSPFAPHRAVQWLATNGPRVLAVIVFVFLARWISRLVGRKVVAAIVRRRGSLQGADRDARAETLGRVFQNATGTAILVLGTLAILDQVGVNVTVLLGGAAVIGAAVAFGSQNLIRDFVAGFMILVENQYSVGSVVKIGDVSGVVEDISLRTTVLRDEEGVVHFIPHGQINTVSNMTYSWSRAVLTIAVSYKEDVDRVMQILLEVAQQLSHDPGFSHSIIDEPEMLGVDALGDSSVSIKFLIKTRPMRQWAVKREVLRRIKKKFDELGIAIPFSQRVVQLVHVET